MNYKLQNVATGRLFDDIGWLLADPNHDTPALIRAIYDKKQIEVGDASEGVYRFSDWLPITRTLKNSSATVTYKSVKLADYLGLKNLYISFSGYWPEKGANMMTCSFKETEAYSVCGRLTGKENGIMVVASAGNTARAFAKVCSDNDIPLLIVVPEDNLDAMWFNTTLNGSVKLISTPSGSDYFDAIDLANKVCKSDYFFEEGGAKNVARRDGMGTTILSAAHEIGAIPDYYFQAIGSGTGAIAAWEANLRLIEDGRFGNHKMKLFLVQNYPFVPMYEAWKRGDRNIIFTNEDEARNMALQIEAKVLSNRRPPYGITGGLFDAMCDAGGDMEIADNRELAEAATLFEDLEGNDIHPAAAIALAGMIKSIDSGKVDKEKVIMLNITGGGEAHFKFENRLFYKKADLIIDNNSDVNIIHERVSKLFM